MSVAFVREESAEAAQEVSHQAPHQTLAVLRASQRRPVQVEATGEATIERTIQY